jgi:UDP-N-acetylglucosamine 2-epimerase (hydrolysing)
MEVEKDGFERIYRFINQGENTSMDIALSNTINGLSNYISEIRPDLIVVHGDRLEALAGAIVGAFNNILVAHIEGGEVSGTIDESIRHAITKLSHIHFVSNEESKKRIIQLGENPQQIYIIGSPDIDIMYSQTLPSLELVRNRYEINFDTYNIFMYHPVTTEYDQLEKKIDEIINALLSSTEKYVIIYPNNDKGSDIIINALRRLEGNPRFLIYPSLRFEYFLTLMKHARFVIGNSSAGIRESIVYGTPTIDIGNRQKGRYKLNETMLIQHVEENKANILKAIQNVPKHNVFEVISPFGQGNSSERFVEVIKNPLIWDTHIQKQFSDLY